MRAGRTSSASDSSTPGHDVIFATSHRALLYLRECFGERAREIFGLTFDYSKGYVAPVATVWKNLWQFPQGHRVNRAALSARCTSPSSRTW